MSEKLKGGQYSSLFRFFTPDGDTHWMNRFRHLILKSRNMINTTSFWLVFQAFLVIFNRLDILPILFLPPDRRVVIRQCQQVDSSVSQGRCFKWIKAKLFYINEAEMACRNYGRNPHFILAVIIPKDN